MNENNNIVASTTLEQLTLSANSLAEDAQKAIRDMLTRMDLEPVSDMIDEFLYLNELLACPDKFPENFDFPAELLNTETDLLKAWRAAVIACASKEDLKIA